MMFREAVTVAVPIAAAEIRLGSQLAVDHLRADAATSHGEAAEILMRAGFGPISKQVRVRILPPHTEGRAVVIPMRWEATSAAGPMFPTLDANIELTATTNHSGQPATEIVLAGSYRPPLGGIGAIVDQALLHQVAQTTIRSFLHHLAAVVDPGPVTDVAPTTETGFAPDAEPA